MAEMKDILVPDIGDFDGVEVIEIMVAAGDSINVEDPIVSLESDKAAMEIPSPFAGTVKEIKVDLGDKVSEGSLLITVEASESSAAAEETAPAKEPETAAPETTAPAPAPATPAPAPTAKPASPRPSPTASIRINEEGFKKAHASPSVRKFARELGADLSQMSGSGNKGRILKEDVKVWVKQALSQGSGGGLGVEPMPEIDFSEFGDIEIQELTRINKLTGKFLHRNWVTVPHVTQFDEADITELEAFRKQLNEENQKDGIRVTVLAFLMKALVSALKEFPRFNSSLDHTGENLILKQYVNIGVAMDTPDGLVVPVIRECDRKSLIELAQELVETSHRARNKKLSPVDMQGGCISISSLGGIGGTSFTPIVNAPEVAILGVSRSVMKPVYKDGEFVPRLMLPLSLSYDHRVIDGADGARFTSYLSRVLSDTRRLLL
ncbi:MAG: dihydrolipoyllysine-residue acetyltransferase [Gammaproteobacteria bacterium]|nr:dihydrolipoyllysine-residue acetyltransferase [Gammaproteobacteria bacterium]MBT8133521.1 dihydrolipoyllysine-residue acetyltransferase [Gammaproteobacteria bacterium]NNJ51063.1 dihydrolipoyllysine-residue acetyltransferase [Gammaproteobacteria bacterium]